ncbi:transposase [Methanosphaerula palustris]|uniref:transposase n=1 Tax=Methanosphaerula palustris TaxID=475088 RepID=UPI0003246FE6
MEIERSWEPGLLPCENDSFWSGLFYEMKERGLNSVQLVISDCHQGIQTAVSTVSWEYQDKFLMCMQPMQF